LPARNEKSESARSALESKPATVKRSGTLRRARIRQETGKANTEERFFLATGNGDGEAPALGRECANETEAIIEAFRGKVNFYRITEFTTRTDLSASGPILRKEAVKQKILPAS